MRTLGQVFRGVKQAGLFQEGSVQPSRKYVFVVVPLSICTFSQRPFGRHVSCVRQQVEKEVSLLHGVRKGSCVVSPGL
jgi:hypothetical protein